MTIPTALKPFEAYKQFIVYVAMPRESRPGKTDKFPVDYRDGKFPVAATNELVWTDYDSAASFAHDLGPAYGVGYVFTDRTPFWFLDIDNCLVDGAWSPIATELCTELAGCAVEVSRSGEGLHLFGVGHIPPHSCTNKSLGLELYHTGRFVALGHASTCVGNALFDATAPLGKIVAKYFSKASELTTPTAWTTEPCVEWNGPTDDDDLIRRACRKANPFGGSKATFSQLWDRDVAALSKTYPDAGAERKYDESSADAALASHLMYWTGRNCSRTVTLMLRSDLRRDKWEREDYLRRTITNAMSISKDVCVDKAPASNDKVVTPTAIEGETILHAPEQLDRFKGLTYVLSLDKVLQPGGSTIDKSRFDVIYGGRTFVMDKSNTKTTKSAWECFTQSQQIQFPKVGDTEFRPDKVPGEIWTDGNRTLVNTYWPIPTASKHGNARPFEEHLARILPDKLDRAIALAYMSAIVQCPGIKFPWALLIQGAPGNGKSLLSEVIIEAIGRTHCHVPNAKELTGKFNGWQEGKLFIAVEDIYVPGHKAEVLEAMKPMITQSFVEIENKQVAKQSRRVWCNYLLNSNHKDALHKSKDDRRYAIMYCAQQSYDDIVRDGMGGDYFPKLYAWLRSDGYAIVNNYLKTYKIPDELNPAGKCHRAPITTSTSEAISESACRLEQEIRHAIESEMLGFRGGWISSHFLNKLIDDNHLSSAYSRNRRASVLLEMGYPKHPGLTHGQVNNAVSPDGVKPVLYIKNGHPCSLLRGCDVAYQYTDAQQTPLLRLIQK